VFQEGQRVEIPVHCDFWMQGDRYGKVSQVVEERTASGRGILSSVVEVRMNSGRLLRLPTADYSFFRFL
jgi:hypothetical protein